MDRTSVESTTVASIGYDQDNTTLEVEFIDGRIYQYFSVPSEVFEQFLIASSKGQYLDQYIKKGGFPFSKVG